MPRQNALSRQVWESRYRNAPLGGVVERSVADTWDRVARTLAACERAHRSQHEAEFRRVLDDFKFLPAGRILAGAGTGRAVTLANCFVTGVLEDSIDGVFDRLKEGAVTMQWGGGIGCDFSPLRPRGPAAPGPVAYMRIWDAMCESLASSGARRGAMMGTLRCDHPDVEAFIAVKRDAAQLRNFNLSVLVTDDFMAALDADADWPLCFPSAAPAAHLPAVEKSWPGFGLAVRCEIARRVPARALWQNLMDAAYDSAEPGVLFIDRINRANNLYYCEQLVATNPCGEVPLPAHGACHLGSVNLPAFVREAFAPGAAFDFAALDGTVATAVRMLDDVIDASAYPLPEQAEQVRQTRRIGLGVTGLADALIMLNLRYDSDAGRRMAQQVLERVRDMAYRTSTLLAAEKGSFPRFERDAHLAGEYVRGLPGAIRDGIARHGVRNSHLLAIAPTGTISVLANNVSSGIEPVFAIEGRRRVVDEDGAVRAYPVTDYAYALWAESAKGALPRAFVTAAELAPDAHLDMLAALAPLVDNSISKTVNVPADLPRSAFMDIYKRAYALGVKGCTVFRPNAVTGAVLTDVALDCCVQARRMH
jgi:ribonucleoside-diphosphate reductase alpha chain